MFIDLSFEYDCYHEEYIGLAVATIPKNGIWIAYHTDKGNKYLLENFNIKIAKPHRRIKISFERASVIYRSAPSDISKSWGGFYWENIEHTKHIGV